MLMIKAGSWPDVSIESLIPLLEPGDIIIDGAIITTPTPTAAQLR